MCFLTADKQREVMDDLFYKRKIDAFMARRTNECLALEYGISKNSLYIVRRRDLETLSPDENIQIRAIISEREAFRPEYMRYTIPSIAKRHNVNVSTVERLWDRWINREPLPRTKP